MKRFIDALVEKYEASGNSLATLNDFHEQLLVNMMERVNFYDDGAGGSPLPADLNILALIVAWLKPVVIYEFGTWVGTSAVTLAEAAPQARVHTCDKRPFYRGQHDRITFYGRPSSVLLANLPRFTGPCQFAFIDASLSDGDHKALIENFPSGRICLCIHDMDMHNGRDNMIGLSCRKGASGTVVFTPDMEEQKYIRNDVLVNDRTGILISQGLLDELYGQ